MWGCCSSTIMLQAIIATASEYNTSQPKHRTRFSADQHFFIFTVLFNTTPSFHPVPAPQQHSISVSCCCCVAAMWTLYRHGSIHNQADRSRTRCCSAFAWVLDFTVIRLLCRYESTEYRSKHPLQAALVRPTIVPSADPHDHSSLSRPSHAKQLQCRSARRPYGEEPPENTVSFMSFNASGPLRCIVDSVKEAKYCLNQTLTHEHWVLSYCLPFRSRPLSLRMCSNKPRPWTIKGLHAAPILAPILARVCFPNLSMTRIQTGSRSLKTYLIDGAAASTTYIRLQLLLRQQS